MSTARVRQGLDVRKIDDIDWARWRPRQLATLLFVLDDREILLIRKKRGLGAGKINGPGGRLDPGETPAEAAVRELREEVGLVASDPRLGGELSFQFVDGLSLHVWVYRCVGASGTVRETDEAVPLWTSIERIPYDQMWSDDRLWLPQLIDGIPFRGQFLFADDQLLDYRLFGEPTDAETEAALCEQRFLG